LFVTLRGSFAARTAAPGGLRAIAKRRKVGAMKRLRLEPTPPVGKARVKRRPLAAPGTTARRKPGASRGAPGLRAPRWLVAGLALVVAACRQGVMDPRGPIASAEWLLMINATEIMLVVVVPVIVATLVFAWWYRASNPRASYSPDWAYQGSIEFIVWSIPTLIVILLAGVCWIGAHQLDPRAPIPSKAKPLAVEVVSLDWKWLFIYPAQGIASVNELVVPAQTPISFELTSATVMNSFFVPQLGSQIYTMPGMTTHVHLLADRPGEYPGISANFSGDGFSDMRYVVKAIAPGDFDGWVAKVKNSGAALDETGFAALAKPSSDVPPATYGSVDPKLFRRIVDQSSLQTQGARTGGPPHASVCRIGG
jgi:cytochrome o ubiquinol oxidase subunit II